jgi:hypothetical protein
MNVEEKIKYMLLSHHQNEGRTSDIKIAIYCKILGFHGGDYEECRLLGWYVVWFLLEQTFRKNI